MHWVKCKSHLNNAFISILGSFVERESHLTRSGFILISNSLERQFKSKRNFCAQILLE